MTRRFTRPLIIFLLQLASKAHGTPSVSSSSSTKASASKWGGSDTDFHKSSLNADKYSSLPHTIFSPDGRLYNIETNACSVSDAIDLSSSLVLAMKFGSGEDESIIVLSTSHISPHLQSHMHSRAQEQNSFREKRTDDLLNKTSGSGGNDEEDKESIIPNSDSSHRLWSHPHLHSSYGDGENNRQSHNHFKVNMPLSILPSNIIIGTGGTAADSMALHTKIRQLGLALYNENDNMRSTHRIQGTVLSSMLAKKIAASLQLPTQSSASSRMFASAAIVVGPDGGGRDGRGAKSRQSIWRCDPTGQFFNCHMAAVGRGAGTAEAVVMSSVAKQGEDGNADETHSIELDDLVSKISSKDVQKFLSTLSFDDAVLLACKCIAKALNLSTTNDSADLLQLLGIQGILIRAKSNACQEVVHPNILQNALRNKC